MSNFTTNPWVANPFTINPWSPIAPLKFTNTGATLDPYIVISGDCEILWTWSDGTTDNVANPGEKTLTGTHTLVVTPWSAVIKIDIDGRNLIGDFITQEWSNLVLLHMYSNSLTGKFIIREWLKLTQIYINNNSFTSISGSLQTQILLSICQLQDNNISSQSEIDKVFSDLLVNAADTGRTAVCNVNTSGTNMSAPSAAGIADASELVTTYGWTVTHS